MEQLLETFLKSLIQTGSSCKGSFGVGDNWRQKLNNNWTSGCRCCYHELRNIYWFLNAIQAATNLANDVVVSNANEDVRGSSYAYDERNAEPTRNDFTKVRLISNESPIGRSTLPAIGYVLKGKKIQEQTNVKPIIPALLGLPSAAINNFGLLTRRRTSWQGRSPFTGRSRKQPTYLWKLDRNTLWEELATYRHEFQEVRPDVSKKSKVQSI